MAIPCYLAMSAAEYAACSALPSHIGWMACHFSLQNNGLSNLPQQLPANALLILDDSIPMENHSIDTILSQLTNMVERFKTTAVLLDFQRHGAAREKELAAAVGEALPCPVVATPDYASKDMPVFLSPAPLHQPLDVYLSAFPGCKLWLDAAPIPTKICVTSTGATFGSCSSLSDNDLPYYESQLHCHYRIDLESDRASFTLQRTYADFHDWLRSAEALGVVCAVGLYQELWKYYDEKAAL